MDKPFVEYEVVKLFKHDKKAAILEYIKLMYDKKSKIIKIENLEDRKLQACHDTNLNPKQDWVREIMEMKNKAVNDIIFTYQGLYQNNNKLQKLLNDQQLFWDMQRIVGANDDPTISLKTRAEMSKASGVLLSSIQKGLSEIFGSDENISVAEEGVRKLVSLESRLKKVS